MMTVPMIIRLLRPALSTSTPDTEVITTRVTPTDTVANTFSGDGSSGGGGGSGSGGGGGGGGGSGEIMIGQPKGGET